MEVKEIMEAVLELPPSQVISKKVELSYKAGNYVGLCPFHNDKHLGSFVVTDRKGIWKCFACASGITGGNAIAFRMKYDNKPYFESAMNIAVEEGIISEAEYEEKLRHPVSKKDIREFTRYSTAKKKKESFDQDLMHQVYQIMHDVSGLSEKHLEHLKQTRMLDEDRIKKDYFSFPCFNKGKVMDKILQALKADPEFDERELEKIPGFFFDREKKRLTYAGYRGIAILIRNAKGKIVGIQIRKDKVKAGESRYVWFSSGFAQKDPHLYRGGAGPGAPIDVVYPTVPKKKLFLGIAEGRFKTEQLAMRGDFIGISVQGVGNYKGIEQEMTNLLESPQVSDTVVVFYDADMLSNIQVLRHAIALSKHIVENVNCRPGINVKFALWHEELGKGIDDLLINGNECDIHYLDASDVETMFNVIVQACLKKHGVKSESELKGNKRDTFYQEVEGSLRKIFF